MSLALVSPPPSPNFIPDHSPLRDYELWPHPGAPQPDLHSHGMTEARCVIQFFHGRTTEEKLDALKHLANISALKAAKRGFYWQSRPFVRFVEARTAKLDYENSSPYSPAQQRVNNAAWFRHELLSGRVIEKFSPVHVTKRELSELARMKDGDLLHVCSALVCDLANAVKSRELRELEFQDKEMAPTTNPGLSLEPDYASAVAMLVKDRKLRAALPTQVRRVLELVFRKLDAGADPTNVISAVAKDISRNARTVRRYLAEARRVAGNAGSAQIMHLLSGLVLPRFTADGESIH